MELSKIGDMIAIPFFFWLMKYFYKKRNERFLKGYKTILSNEEIILFLFVTCGFIADIFFVFFYKN